MTTPPPTQEPHHCLFCQRALSRSEPDLPWKDTRGSWRCDNHPRIEQTSITPHQPIPGRAVDRPR